MSNEHLINKAVNFVWHIRSMRNWLSLRIEACVPMGFQKRFSNRYTADIPLSGRFEGLKGTVSSLLNRHVFLMFNNTFVKISS